MNRRDRRGRTATVTQQSTIQVRTRGKGLYAITSQVREALGPELPDRGLVNIFIRHTSASLLIQENADPSAREDLEEFIERLAPEGQGWHRHTAEGPDDTTSHLKSAVTATSLNLPVTEGELGLGTWQGVYLWEHRTASHTRKIVLTLIS